MLKTVKANKISIRSCIKMHSFPAQGLSLKNEAMSIFYNVLTMLGYLVHFHVFMI